MIKKTIGIITRAFGVRQPPKSVRSHPAVQKLLELRREIATIKGKYDATSDGQAFKEHWLQTDNLSPDAANSAKVRKKLRSRARYECVENNPYLLGTILTICNDFVGTGPKLQITDQRLQPERRRYIENMWDAWSKDLKVKYRQKLWQHRIQKIVDGEACKKRMYNPLIKSPVRLGFEIFETDRLTAENPMDELNENEVDGVRFDKYGNPTKYFILNQHPGEDILLGLPQEGKWIDARWITHWFRKNRPWARGIPEITTSLNLCVLLRRYTLAVVLAAEALAEMGAIVLETEGLPSTQAWTDGSGNINDESDIYEFFDVFPISKGQLTTLPGGYKAKQLKAEQPVAHYDAYVDILLREIIRPLNCPFNIGAGTSKDSNMASAVVDTHIYRGGQDQERLWCNEDVLDEDLEAWWDEAVLLPGFLNNGTPIGDGDFFRENPSLREQPPAHVWGWDRVGLEHTDPEKVATALQIMHQSHFVTDKDIQEGRFNRRLEDWQEEIQEQQAFRDKAGLNPPEPTEQSAAKQSGSNSED